MSAYGTKRNLLVLLINLVKKTFVCKCTIVGMVVLDGAIGLTHEVLESLDCQNRSIYRVIVHQVNVDKVTDMITKCSTTPNAATAKEARHLWDEPG